MLRRLADCEVEPKVTRLVEQGRNTAKRIEPRRLANRLMVKVGELR
jgi:hypothetical protein